MDEAESKSYMDSLKDQSLDTVRGLAPWRAGLPWWVVLVEGIVLGVVGILILIDPRQTTVNLALFLAAAMGVAGILQLWAVMRGKVPESSDALIAARGAVGVFASATVLLLFFLNYLPVEAGLILFGLGSLVFGLVGLWAGFVTRGTRRRSGIVEGVFFTLFGALMFYVLIAGSAAVETATTIVGWAAIVGGVVLLVLAFLSRSKQQQGYEIDDMAGAAASQPDSAAKDTREAMGQQWEMVEDKAGKVEDTQESMARSSESSGVGDEGPKTE